ncbi:ABC transporter G family member 25 [Abeliophyllum distichum]|uniref:ABC transporter G family member 25 n=1 Tax=Abeliophyllum distichum TaxID=126358 RepID=A0ABD1SAC6_9LAMI
MAGFDEAAETPNGDPSKQSSWDSNSYPITLKFIDVCYRVKMENSNEFRRTSLRNMFKAGSTSSSDVENQTARINQERTILNGITGMVSPGQILAVLGPSGSGKSTLLNALAGRPPPWTRPHRLPVSLSRNEKISTAESVIQELGLVKCENTIIGNSFIRGISGGERKRVSIAHEMLINPSLLILDEPTSGLDSTAAFRLVATLGSLAEKGKTIVTSVHQPSSRVYQAFDSVVVLSEGRCIYFGKGNEAMNYFESVGFCPSFPMNPADFLLDLANGVSQVDGIRDREKPNVRQNLVSSYNAVLAPKVKAACLDSTSMAPKETLIVGKNTCDYKKSFVTSFSTWFDQFIILLQRNMKERKHETFNSLRVFQVIAASLLAGFMWWHSDYRDIQDRLGLLFFISIFWGVFPSFNAVFAFPQERAIFVKERASGMYTLSSYFMARITGDLPMEMILPTLFLAIAYWMTGLKPELSSFLLTLMVLIGYVLVSQGLGLALGALIMDAKQASTVVTVTMLAYVLTGGFYVHKVPAFMSWFKYVSTTFYSYRLLINVQYGDGKQISSFLGCSINNGRERASCKFVNEDIVGQMHPAMCVGILLIMFVGYRLLAYIALWRIRA